MKTLALLAAAAITGISGLARAAEISECAKIDDDIVRLFCYDRAAGRPMPAAARTDPDSAEPPSGVAKPEPQAASGPDDTAAIGVIGPTRPEAGIEVEAAPDLPPKDPIDADAGAGSKGATAADRPAERVDARIVGAFQGWSPGTRFILDNGQVWEAVGASTHYSKSDAPAVTIRRDFLGQYLMSVEGVKSKALVRPVEP